MKIRSMLLAALIMLMTTGCYFPISGKILDADTNAPIEGAVVLVEWTKTHGIGDHWTESYKVAEALSDKEGEFDLPGCYSPFVNPPDLTIYKKGYVAWSSRWIFPDYKQRKQTNNMFTEIQLDRFRAMYSHKNHINFIRTSINNTIGYDMKKLMHDAYAWEIDLSLNE